VAAEFEAALTRIRRTGEANGLTAGLHTRTGEEAARRISEGFTFLTVASDMTHLETAAAAHFAAADRQRSATSTP
jgi:4-hydroxy-2-oxoheptanedioate aldolase